MKIEAQFDEMIETSGRSVEAQLKITPVAEHMAVIENIYAQNSVVFGVYPDETVAKGWGALLLKGKKKLRIVAESGQSAHLSVAAIPCVELEQAVALRRHCSGNKKWVP